MIRPKTMRDISVPRNSLTKHSKRSQNASDRKGKGKLHYSAFVLNEIKSPQDIKIDRQLQSIFNRLNQSYSTSINTPHTAFLRQQIDDFLHICQTRHLFEEDCADQ